MTGNSRFRPVVVARFAERSKLSCKFISVRKVVKIRFIYSSDRRSRPYATTVSLFAVVLTQSAISAWRAGVVLPSAISRRNSEQSCSTVVRKCWTQSTSVSSSCGTGSWHQHKLAELDMVADIPTLYPFHKQGPYQSTGRNGKRSLHRAEAEFAGNRRTLPGFQPQSVTSSRHPSSPFVTFRSCPSVRHL